MSNRPLIFLTVALVPVALGAVFARVPLRTPPDATHEQLIDALRARYARVAGRTRVARRLTFLTLLLLIISAFLDAVSTTLRGALIFATVWFFIVWMVLWSARIGVENDIDTLTEAD